MRTRQQQCFDTELLGCRRPRRRIVTRFRLANYSFHHAHTGISLLYGRPSTNGENFKAFRRKIKKL